MAAILETEGYKSVWQPKTETENPRDPRCKLAFQRICGTCRHHQGALKPERGGPGSAAYNTAECAYFQVQKHRLAKAWNCHRWERKGPANG